eukprot:ANDGO_01502.mRNA.1 Ubiquitin-conjugating enzyme E2 22
MSTSENIAPLVVKRLLRETTDILKTPPEGIAIHASEDDFSTLSATIDGPTGTPYEGGKFVMRLTFDGDFPNVPPKGVFLTRIFHPNISTKGEICVSTLKKDWSADLGIRHVLMVVRCLLIEPNPESALNEEAGKLLLENYEEFAKHAKLMTLVHAASPLLAAEKAKEKSEDTERTGEKEEKREKKSSAAADAKRKSLKRL